MNHHYIFVSATVKRPLQIIERARAFLTDAVEACGMRVIAGPYGQLGVVPGNEGVSAVAILDLSSASLHEWPDQGLINLDIYTCGNIPSQDTIAELFSHLEPLSIKMRVLNRDKILENECCCA